VVVGAGSPGVGAGAGGAGVMTVKTVSCVTVGISAAISATTRSYPIDFAAVLIDVFNAAAKVVVSLSAVSTFVASVASVV